VASGWTRGWRGIVRPISCFSWNGLSDDIRLPCLPAGAVGACPIGLVCLESGRCWVWSNSFDSFTSRDFNQYRFSLYNCCLP